MTADFNLKSANWWVFCGYGQQMASPSCDSEALSKQNGLMAGSGDSGCGGEGGGTWISVTGLTEELLKEANSKSM